MDENIRTLIPDEVVKPIAMFTLDVGYTEKAIILDRTNLIILKNYEYRSYRYARDYM